MRRFAILACALAGIVVSTQLCQTGPGSRPTDEEAVALVRDLDQALNAHDAEAAIKLLGPDAVVQDDRRPQSNQQIEGWLNELNRQQVRVELIDSPTLSRTSQAPEGTTVTWHATLYLDMYRALGLPFVPATLEARVVNDSIVFVRIRPDPRWNPILDETTVA